VHMDRRQGWHDRGLDLVLAVDGSLHLRVHDGLVEDSALMVHREVVLHCLVDLHNGLALRDGLTALHLPVVDSLMAGSWTVGDPAVDNLKVGIQAVEHHSSLEVVHRAVVGNLLVEDDRNAQAQGSLLLVGNPAVQMGYVVPWTSCGSDAQLHVCRAPGALPHPSVSVSLTA